MFNLSDDQIQRALAENGTPDGTNGQGILSSGARTLARFYMHATKDAEASQKAGRTIYRQAPFVEMWAEGATDKASHPVERDDIRNYPQEWMAFERQQKDPVHSVMALPNFSAIMRRYCEDAEIYTIEQLSKADVQPELEPLKAMAIRWLGLLHAETETPPKRRGRKPGSKNKPKVAADVQVS